MSTVCEMPVRDVIAVGPSRWRVLDRDGRIRGVIEATTTPGGFRFRALRFHPQSASFRCLGEFWNPTEAADCLRYLV